MLQHPTSHPYVVSQARNTSWKNTLVEGRAASYAVAGAGAPVVFLHGYALTPRAYDRALLRMAAQGVRVFAPSLPGFGGTAELPPQERNLAGYARWLDGFLDSIGIAGPVTLVGHSFGGGVAIQSAHDLGPRVARLVLVNSVGGAAWSPGDGDVRPIGERPLWAWGAAATGDALAIRPSVAGLLAITADAVGNVLRNPLGMWRLSHLARTADLLGELDELAERGLPVTLLWGGDDTFIPRASFESLRIALRNPTVVTVAGNHGWLIDNPHGFGTAMATVFGAEQPQPHTPAAVTL
ncbi:alpha/beta hydrolase [Rhodococcus oryzae]|uniref:Alpha/beta hydrolase n=1 Tax=Rhodococcus oryzae TaxID=2571143 RepID=A0ABY2RN18_9NOCA|nr:alpha/beta hydrolase [Rhodococcus oryzae]TJZ79603.1 alpha/beta hydrolase [Rhodococcus oryzae]